MYSSPAITFFEVVNHVYYLEISYVQSRAICLSRVDCEIQARISFVSRALFKASPEYRESAKKNLSIFDGRQSFDSSGLG